MKNMNDEKQWQCPFCKSVGPFEENYLGAFPHLYKYTCPQCGVSGPIGSGQTEKEAIQDAKIETIKFLDGYYRLENISKYQLLASRTIPTNKEREALLLNFCLGLVGESGELIDHIKKHLFHGHNIDNDYVSKEIGDMQWYMNAIASCLNLSMNNILQENIDKLLKRYPEGFSEERSKNRGNDG